MTTEHEQLRLQHWRLKIIQEATSKPRNIAPVCRRYHISRPGALRAAFYKWHARYLARGIAGLRDQQQGPHHCPRATHPDIVEKILYLRRHYSFGAVRISLYVRRYHDLIIAQRTIQRILKRRGLNRLPKNMRFKPHKQRWRRYEKPLPGHRLQIDAKFLEPIPGKRRSRRSMRGALDVVAGVLTGGRCDAFSLHWGAVRYQHAAAVRAVSLEG